MEKQHKEVPMSAVQKVEIIRYKPTEEGKPFGLKDVLEDLPSIIDIHIHLADGGILCLGWKKQGAQVEIKAMNGRLVAVPGPNVLSLSVQRDYPQEGPP